MFGKKIDAILEKAWVVLSALSVIYSVVRLAAVGAGGALGLIAFAVLFLAALGLTGMGVMDVFTSKKIPSAPLRYMRNGSAGGVILSFAAAFSALNVTPAVALLISYGALVILFQSLMENAPERHAPAKRRRRR